MKKSTLYLISIAAAVILFSVVATIWQKNSEKTKYKKDGVKVSGVIIDKIFNKYYSSSQGHKQLQIEYYFLVRYEINSNSSTKKTLQDAYARVTYEENLKFNKNDQIDIYYLKSDPSKAQTALFVEKKSLL